MSMHFEPNVRMIPIEHIDVLNPRERGRKKFGQITGNIAKLGLKKPITVAVAAGRNDGTRYDLVCGQGRLEAYRSLGEKEIPAILATGTREELLLMSLAENLARRQPSCVELLRDVRRLKDSGYVLSEIARKIDVDITYVRGILQLLDRGEDRLLQAVERGQLPMSIAITIAVSDDKAVQRALQDAYESHDLRGQKLIRARQLIELRRTKGKKPRGGARPADAKPVSAETVLRTFQQETLRQKMIVQKAKICETRLLFAVSALRQLFQEAHFVTLLRAEGLDTLPEYLADQISTSGGKS